MLEWLMQRAQPDLDWNYAMITLVVRFIAVFVVLWVIQGAMQLSAYFLGDDEQAEAGGSPTTTSSASDEVVADSGKPDDLTLAAIAIALELESQPEATRVPDDRKTSTWAVAGRVTGQRR